ncbi:M48 family metalloprotease [Stenotrophomonas maltophilia]|uniref:M48 family metalloprotease n=1 Tax=Stenotrophomonas maltophilia TaxID=40324 RepID=UPI00313ADC91
MATRRPAESARLQLQDLVNDLASRAHIAPPRVKLWRKRNARYNAATHCIAVSVALADGLNEAQLRTLLAHEVGHASRRVKTLRRVLKYLFPLSLIMLATGIVGFNVGGFSATQDVATGLRAWGALLVIGVGTLAAARVQESIEKRARRDAYAEELHADRFAKRHGDPSADIGSVLDACAQIEDSGTLGPEAMRRTRFARRSHQGTSP